MINKTHFNALLLGVSLGIFFSNPTFASEEPSRARAAQLAKINAEEQSLWRKLGELDANKKHKDDQLKELDSLSEPIDHVLR